MESFGEWADKPECLPVNMCERVMWDHLVLGVMSLIISRSVTSDACTTLRAVARVEGEGAWAGTTRLEDAVHFTLTTRVCECLGWPWRDLLMLVTRSTKDGQSLDSI